MRKNSHGNENSLRKYKVDKLLLGNGLFLSPDAASYLPIFNESASLPLL